MIHLDESNRVMSNYERAEIILESIKALTTIDDVTDFTAEDGVEIVKLAEDLVKIINSQEKSMFDLMSMDEDFSDLIRIEEGTPQFDELMKILNMSK